MVNITHSAIRLHAASGFYGGREEQNTMTDRETPTTNYKTKAFKRHNNK